MAPAAHPERTLDTAMSVIAMVVFFGHGLFFFGCWLLKKLVTGLYFLCDDLAHRSARAWPSISSVSIPTATLS
jgi:hypothetical protein